MINIARKIKAVMEEGQEVFYRYSRRYTNQFVSMVTLPKKYDGWLVKITPIRPEKVKYGWELAFKIIKESSKPLRMIEIRELTGLNKSNCYVSLIKLIKEGCIIKTGRSKAARYTINLEQARGRDV